MYFDRVYELSYDNLIKSNEESSKTILVKSKPPEYDLHSPEFDLIREVINTKEIVNIRDAKQDPKYAKVRFKTSFYLICCKLLRKITGRCVKYFETLSGCGPWVRESKFSV